MNRFLGRNVFGLRAQTQPRQTNPYAARYGTAGLRQELSLRALKTVIDELDNNEAFPHGPALQAMHDRLLKGQLPAAGKPIAVTEEQQLALDLVTRKELNRKDSIKRDILPDLIAMGPSFGHRAGPRNNPLFVEWGAVPYAPLAAARQMVARGANVNSRSADGDTALMWRTVHKDVGAVAALLTDMNANPRLTDRTGVSAPMIAGKFMEHRPGGLRTTALVKIFQAHAEGQQREVIKGIARDCLERHEHRRGQYRRPATGQVPGAQA